MLVALRLSGASVFITEARIETHYHSSNIVLLSHSSSRSNIDTKREVDWNWIYAGE